MPTLTPGRPLTTSKPEILVENQLPAGRYRFELVVTDDADLESAPAELVVVVRGRPPIDPTRPPIDTRPPIEPRRPRIDPVLRPDVVRPVVRPGAPVKPRPGIVRPLVRPKRPQ